MQLSVCYLSSPLVFNHEKECYAVQMSVGPALPSSANNKDYSENDGLVVPSKGKLADGWGKYFQLSNVTHVKLCHAFGNDVISLLCVASAVFVYYNSDFFFPYCHSIYGDIGEYGT